VLQRTLLPVKYASTITRSLPFITGVPRFLVATWGKPGERPRTFPARGIEENRD